MRATIKPGKESKSLRVVEEEKRMQKENREKDRGTSWVMLEHMPSSCWDKLPEIGCGKSWQELKKQQYNYVIDDAFHAVQNVPTSCDMPDVIKVVKKECFFVGGTGLVASYKISGKIGTILLMKLLAWNSRVISSWSIKVSIAAQKFATSTLMSAPLKVVTIECIEHDVTCLNERVFIKTMNHLLTNCSQSTLLAMICRLSVLVLNAS